MKTFWHLLIFFLKLGGCLFTILLIFTLIHSFQSQFQKPIIPGLGDIYPPPQNDNGQAQLTPKMQSPPYPEPNEQSLVSGTPKQTRFVGPDCVVDDVKNLSLQIPEGWYVDIGLSSINIFNYNPDALIYEHGDSKNLPTNNIKIEIYIFELKPGQTLEEWVSEEKAQTKGRDDHTSTVSQNVPYNLGQYDGLAYSITDTMGWNSRIIALQADSKKGAVANIFPADSSALSDALVVLASLDMSGNSTCSGKAFLPERNFHQSKDLIQTNLPKKPTFECPTGVTYPGVEANNSTIDIQMPFTWGQIWIVGGKGAFYGNYHHCNYYNNYYATDWNRPDNNDKGFTVVSVANGWVSGLDSPPCTTARYGCYVDVDHTSGYRTRYAYLESVFVNFEDLVRAGTPLGTVGQSGTNNDHLHLSFWHWDRSDYPYHYEYFGQCYNNRQTCPNGEAPFFPQGYRPSPMRTSYGNTFLVDGLAFTSINGWAIFIPLIIS